jgi:hypothetical protein
MASQSEIDANIIRILSGVTGAYKDMQMKDMFGCIVKIMESAEEIPALVGVDKKKIVIGVLSQLVNSIPFPDPRQREIVLGFVNSGLAGLMIDGIIKITKEGCRINVEHLENACAKCCCCCSGSKCNIM